MGEFPNKETMFKPGQGGRPKGARNRSTVVREMIEAAANPTLKRLVEHVAPDAQTVAEQMVASMIMAATAGDVKAFNALMDSAYGKLTDKIENTHSFTKMGKVIAEQSPDPSAGVAQQSPRTFELSFDIGDAPDAEPETDDDLP